MFAVNSSNLATTPFQNYAEELDRPCLEATYQSRVFRSIENILSLYRNTWSYKLEKTAKISYRIIDLVGLFNGPLRESYVALSSILKDIALAIESTNFFFVSYPLFVRDQNGRTYFETRTKVQSAETLSLTCHLFLKMFVGAERARLLKLGIIGSYTIGHVPIFRYALESLILLFNFFGIWDGARKFSAARIGVHRSEAKIAKWDARKAEIIAKGHFSDLPGRWTQQGIESKQRKWKLEQYNKHIDYSKACFKIAAKVSKFVLIVFAVTLMTVNVMTPAYLAIILNLGIISDAIGLVGFLFNEYCAETPPPFFRIPLDLVD
jgi:hypothetical protein